MCQGNACYNIQNGVHGLVKHYKSCKMTQYFLSKRWIKLPRGIDILLGFMLK